MPTTLLESSLFFRRLDLSLVSTPSIYVPWVGAVRFRHPPAPQHPPLAARADCRRSIIHCRASITRPARGTAFSLGESRRTAISPCDQKTPESFPRHPDLCAPTNAPGPPSRQPTTALHPNQLDLIWHPSAYSRLSRPISCRSHSTPPALLSPQLWFPSILACTRPSHMGPSPHTPRCVRHCRDSHRLRLLHRSSLDQALALRDKPSWYSKPLPDFRSASRQARQPREPALSWPY